MDKIKLYTLKKESVNLEPLLSVGKNGMADSVIEELKKQLKLKKLVKVRIHKNSGESDDMKQTAAELAEMCNAEVIDVRGRTVTLYKQ
ncbi:MAG: YhbY family RNA-binding protein [Methanosarcinales archaeon]|jgi:RNA-binding protein|nr:YhbY family RNA-binding protein [Methanosarcinales archaeon]